MEKIQIIEKICTAYGARFETVNGRGFIYDEWGEMPTDNLTAAQLNNYYFGDGSLVPSVVF